MIIKFYVKIVEFERFLRRFGQFYGKISAILKIWQKLLKC